MDAKEYLDLYKTIGINDNLKTNCILFFEALQKKIKFSSYCIWQISTKANNDKFFTKLVCSSQNNEIPYWIKPKNTKKTTFRKLKYSIITNPNYYKIKTYDDKEMIFIAEVTGFISINIIFNPESSPALLKPEKNLLQLFNIFILSINNVKTPTSPSESDKKNNLLNNIENVAMAKFTAKISHLLITPLNGISGNVKVLHSQLKPGAETENFNLIFKSISTLRLNIFNILEYIKISNTKPDKEKSIVNIYQLIENEISDLKNYYPNENLEIKNTIKRIPEFYAQKEYLQLIVSNIVRFIVQNLASKTIWIECNLSNSVAKSNTVQMIFKGNSSQISKKRMDEIIQLTQKDIEQISKTINEDDFGFAFSNLLIKTIGGNMEVQFGNENTFQVDVLLNFPILKSSLPKEEKIDIDWLNLKNLKNLKVLVVEDHEVNQFLISSILNTWSTKTEIVNNGEQAIEKLKKNNYDIILMDLQMPVMNGFDTTVVIRKSLGLNIPIIALTANISAGVKENCLKAGMNDIILKPFDPKELYEKITDSLQKELYLHSSKKEDKEIKQNEVFNIKMKGRFYDLSKLETLLLGNKTELKKMIDLFTNISPSLIQEIKDGANSKDIKKIKTAAHKLKPSVDFLKIDKIKNEIRELEKLPDNMPLNNQQYAIIKQVSDVLSICINELK